MVYHGFSGEAANPERDLQLVHHQILLLQEQHGHLEERRETQPQPAQVLRESGGRKRSRVDGGRDRVPEEEGTEIPQGLPCKVVQVPVLLSRRVLSSSWRPQRELHRESTLSFY